MDYSLIIYVLIAIAITILSFYVPGLRGIWSVIFRSFLSEKVLRKLFLIIAEKLVKSTKNKLDDVWFEEVKKNLE